MTPVSVRGVTETGVKMALSPNVSPGEDRSEDHHSLEKGFGKEVLAPDALRPLSAVIDHNR